MSKKTVEDKLIEELVTKDLLRSYDFDHPVWKQIVVDNIHTEYEVSNIGTVRNSNRNELKIYCHEKSYPCVYLQGFPNMMTVHRLVAQAFIPNPDNKPQVNHIDGNRKNNWVGNLEWVTSKENSEHAWRMGIVDNNGENQGNSIYTNDQVEKLCQLMSQGILDYKELERVTGIKPETISDIRLRRQWRSVSEKYKFNDKANCPKYSDSDIISVCQLLEDPTIPLTVISKYTKVDVYTLKDIIKGHSYMRIAKDYVFPKRIHRGQYSGIAKYTNDQIERVCIMLEESKYSMKEISLTTGVGLTVVYDVLHRRRWTIVSDKYNFNISKSGKVNTNHERTKTSTTIDQH